MPGIGLVFNPRAGKNRHDPKCPDRLARKLGDRGVVAVPRDLDELDKAAESFRKQEIEVLAIAGGDGTNHVTLSHFNEVYGQTPLPTVAFLRGGTMNTVANSLGLPRGTPEGLLDRLLRRYLEPKPLSFHAQQSMNIDGKLGFLWGIGAIPAYLREYYATGAPSPSTAAKTLLRAAASAFVGGEMVRRMCEPVWAETEMSTGERWPMQPYFALGAGTIPDIGLGFRPYFRAGERRDTFHLQGIHTTPVGFTTDLPRIFRAMPMSTGKATDVLVDRAKVRVRGDAMAFMIDGELIEHPSPEVTITMGPTVRLCTMA